MILSATPHPADPAPRMTTLSFAKSYAGCPLTLRAHISPVTIVAPVP